MNVRAETIVDDELNNIKTMLKKIPDPNAKDEADRLGLRTIDVDIKNNEFAYNVLKNFMANMILEEVSDKSKKINYEQIIKEIVTHIMTFCIGYKAALIKPQVLPSVSFDLNLFISFFYFLLWIRVENVRFSFNASTPAIQNNTNEGIPK